MADAATTLRNAIKAGDVDSVRDILRASPRLLGEVLKFDEGYSGYPLHCAAWFNQPAVVELLAAEFGQDVNRQDGVGCEWTPLHHAEKAGACAAAAALLALGADPARRNNESKSTIDFCQSPGVRELDPDYREKARRMKEEEHARRVAGTWERAGARSVAHHYELPGGGLRLTDVFNFDARVLRAVATDLHKGGIAQTVVPFADLAAEALDEPLAKLKELGGDAREEDLNGGRLLHKGLKLPRS